MWSYYGAKTNIVDAYPKPKHHKIKEPFCGTARYALKYYNREVHLMDKYDVIIDIWKWLQKCSVGDIMRLPLLKVGDNINDFKFDCPEARNLMGFIAGFGSSNPRHTATVRQRDRPNSIPYTLKRISSELFKIKHWKIELGEYSEMPNEEATWFIDPPYQHGGHYYRHSNKKIDFNLLKWWSMSRAGQVIVCENSKADWMDFKPLIHQDVLSGRNQEVIWTSEAVSYMGKQTRIF